MKNILLYPALVLTLLISACSGSGSDSSSSGGSSSGGTTGPLEGCWRSTALSTDWCFSGTTSEIKTASNNGIPATQISGLNQMTFTSSTMTYRIYRAAVEYSDGTFLYDNPVNEGPFTQQYALSSTGSSFTAGSGTYTRTSGGGGGTNPAPSPTTGQIAVWTSRSTTQTGSISVKIDNVSAGSLTQYFSSGTPTCGDSGTITKTLSAGTHSISAVDGTLTWGPGSFSITAGSCLTYRLN